MVFSQLEILAYGSGRLFNRGFSIKALAGTLEEIVHSKLTYLKSTMNYIRKSFGTRKRL